MSNLFPSDKKPGANKAMNKLGKHKTIITKRDSTVKSKLKTWFKNFFWFFFASRILGTRD